MLYCLKIVRAYPDYKRPYASVSIYHFLNKEDANEKRREEKRQYYKDFLDFLKEQGEFIPRDVDNINEDDAQSDFFYRDSYMDMEPFSAELYEITIEDDSIISKVIKFPKSNIIEGYVKYNDVDNENDENEPDDD